MFYYLAFREILSKIKNVVNVAIKKKQTAAKVLLILSAEKIPVEFHK